MRLTFAEYHQRWPDLSGPWRMEMFFSLLQREQAEAWAELSERSNLRIEQELIYLARETEAYCPHCRDRTRVHEPGVGCHRAVGRSHAATSSRPATVALSSDDPLKSIAPCVYVEALTGEQVPANGWLLCPLPDHDDRTPSFQVLSSHWRCFGCSRGGSIIDFGAALYGLRPRGQGWWEIRDRLVDDLEGGSR